MLRLVCWSCPNLVLLIRINDVEQQREAGTLGMWAKIGHRIGTGCTGCLTLETAVG